MIYLCRLAGPMEKREAHRWERRAGWALLRWAVSRRKPEWNGLPLSQILEIGPHGKPALKGEPFHFNLSHSGGLAVCAVEDCRVGVDVEKKRAFSPKLKERICTPGELSLVEAEEDENEALTRLWTMKESYMKYTGLGLAQGVRATEFSLLGERPKLKSGAACFLSADLGEAFLTLCTSRPVPLLFSWIDPKRLQCFFIDRFPPL